MGQESNRVAADDSGLRDNVSLDRSSQGTKSYMLSYWQMCVQCSTLKTHTQDVENGV